MCPEDAIFCVGNMIDEVVKTFQKEHKCTQYCEHLDLVPFEINEK